MAEGSTFALNKQMEAAKILREQMAALAENDPEFLRDVIEGETDLHEQITALVLSVVADEAIAKGTGELIGDFQDRKKRIEARADTKRTLIASAMEIGELAKLETPGGTVSTKAVPARVIILEEADIPSKYFEAQPAPPPALDRAAVAAALKARFAALDAAGEIDDPEARAAAREKAEADFPAIPGATLGNGGRTIQIRV